VIYIAPPFPAVLEQKVKLHFSLIVNFPLPLIVEYIAPPTFALHPHIVTPLNSTSPRLLMVKLNTLPFPPVVLMLLNYELSLIVNFYATVPPTVPLIILASAVDVIGYVVFPILLLPNIYTSPVPAPIDIRSKLMLNVEFVIKLLISNFPFTLSINLR
jgi:hypothetical protein